MADAYIRKCQETGESIATRKASQNTLNAFGPTLPELLGGSADLAGSNNTIWEAASRSRPRMPMVTTSITACVSSP